MNDLDLAVLKRAATNGFHSVRMCLDANESITLTVISPTRKTTISSVIHVEKHAVNCSFSFSEKELKNGGKVELTSHTFNCETITDIVQILDKFRTHLQAAHIDVDSVKAQVEYKDALEAVSKRVDDIGTTLTGVSKAFQQAVGRAPQAPTPPMPAPPDAPLWGAHQPPAPPAPVRGSEPNWPTAKKEDDLPFNTDLDEEDKT